MAWRYCLRCGRCYKSGEFRVCCEGTKHCPYDDCLGFSFLHGMAWGVLRKTNPSYPETPERGVYYPLYSEPPTKPQG